MTLFSKQSLALVAGMALLAGCHAAPQSRADRATTAACRADVDRVYAAQNRSDLSRRDQRDTPLSDNYLSGITSRGLGALFGRDTDISSCISNSSAPGTAATAADVGTGPTFNPSPQ
jgi:hypothetical protein